MSTEYLPLTRPQAARRVAQVLAAGARERIRRRPALTAADVPRSALEITPRWLTAVLSRHAPGVRVRSVHAGAVSVGTTTRATLTVIYEDDADGGLPARLFAKCTSGMAQRLMLGLGGFIDGEPGFYNQVRPRLDIEAPAGYHAGVDPRSWRSIVLMEDVVGSRGARFWQPSTAVTVDQVEALLADAATWHATLWDSPRLTEWRWLRTPAEQMRLIDSLIGVANRLPAGARRAAAVIPPALRGRQSDLYDGLRRAMQIAGERPHTYLHGDLHIANTYLTADRAAGVADWQTTLKGSWAHDYAYLVTTALEVEDRRAWEDHLLDHYLGRLAAAGGPAIPRPQAWLAYRQATLYPYFAWVYTIGRSRLQPAFQPDEVSLTLIRRIATAIDDLGSLRAVGL